MQKIMIIDDDPTSLAIGRAFLEGEYQMFLMRSGPQALGALKGEIFPDLILLDMLMPGLSGMDVLTIIKQDENLKDIPVIFLTGERSTDWEIQGYTGGAADFLQKPVNPSLLKVKIQQQLTYITLKRENIELKRENTELKRENRELQESLEILSEQ